MQLPNLAPLPIDAYLEVADGVVRLKGHRIGIAHIVERYREGWGGSFSKRRDIFWALSGKNMASCSHRKSARH